MIDLTPTDEQAALKQTARTFAERELAPVVERIHASPDEIEPWPLLRPAYERWCELGFDRILLDGSCVDAVLVFEELGAVDVGAAAGYFALTASMLKLVQRAGRSEWIGDGPVLLSGALSEPDRAGSDLFYPGADPAVGVQTMARRDDAGWRIDGAKSAFVTNAGVADAYFVMARTASDAPPAQALTMFRVQADAPGVIVGERTRLAGWRAASHAELVLDGVRVGDDAVVGGVGQAGRVFAGSPEIAITLAACYVGLARAAAEYARQYAAGRISWTVTIDRHPNVALRLAEAELDVRAARLLVWDAALAADSDPLTAATIKAPAAKVFAVDAAIRNAQRCVEVLGAYGVASEYKAARYLNDAWVGWSCDFTRDLLLLGLAAATAPPPAT